ncbi:MAG TPA: gluconate 2-dehydrogenase subunit 3 family protein, partial [Puia sp.]|nr:gluconate 2-dehydrogenase subunit 3 family protein [Puia sp.]
KKSPDIAYLEKKRELLADLAETIIPATDSPGAKDAAVQDFIIVMVRDCADIKTKNRFIDGLKELEHYCEAEYKQGFSQCSPQEKQQVMKYFMEKGRPFRGVLGKVQNRLLGKSFFQTLQEYSAEGYCTSEIGATRGLAYIPIPGKYMGCTPLQKGQRSWATK